MSVIIKYRYVHRLTSCSEHLPIWAEAAVKNSRLMGWNLNVPDKCWVTPNAEGVVREAAGTDDLAIVWAPSKAGDLRTSIDTVDSSSGGRVPEVNMTIVRSTASCKEVWLPWAPAEGLDSSLVIGLAELGNCKR